MASGFSGDVFYGNGQVTERATSLTGLQQQQGGVLSTMDQMVQQRADLFMGKRSFGDYQQQQNNPLLVFQQQQRETLSYLQQQRETLSYLQQHRQQQYLMRSVKSRTLDLPDSISSSPSTHFGVPIYGQFRQQHQPLQQQKFINNNNNFLHHNNTQVNPTNNCLISNLPSTNTNLMNPIQTQNPGYPTIGYSNVAQPNSDLQDHKILNTLHELEKQLLNDDNNDNENDAVSVITNSEWSETFQTLMGSNPNPNPNPSPSPNQTCSSTSGSNNSHNNNPLNNNNNIISPSPTSSTSSCCSTSAPSQQLPPPPETLSPKQLIIESANAIIERKTEALKEFLTRLARISNPKGNSEQRLGFYLGNALSSRAFPADNPAPVLELYSMDQLQAMYSLNDMSPCFKFGLLAANLVMLEAITIALQEGVKVHVIDFDLGQGGQYVNLLRALAERRSQLVAVNGAVCDCEIKVTVVDTEVDSRGGVMESVRDGLIKLAERVGIKLIFNGLTRKITELTRESLGCEEVEAIIVNLAFKVHRVPDESVSVENLRDELLRRVKGLNPRAVTLVEQEMNGNTAPFLTRVNEACGFYGPLFDSLDSTLPREHIDRIRVEEGLGRKMANAVACEGRERVERAEVFGKWRARMGMAGFELKPLSPNVAESMRAKLNSARNGNPGFTVKEESGGVGFGWMGRTLTVASAWR